VRKAFTADVAAGKTLVVADYGQLELRILAHMAGCESMRVAFEAGGDFHSRTALGMYDHIKEAIQQGGCWMCGSTGGFAIQQGGSVVAVGGWLCGISKDRAKPQCRVIIVLFFSCCLFTTILTIYDCISPSAERCLLEWEGEGAPPLPLLKDLFASERRKAKVLNFSIAYGKTAHGLSKDWNVTLNEAKATVDKWYADRPEVSKGGHVVWVWDACRGDG
jgi:hypothetical protein